MRGVAAGGVVLLGGLFLMGTTGGGGGSSVTVIKKEAAAPAPGSLTTAGTPSPAWDKVPAGMRPFFFNAKQKTGCALADPWLLAGVAEVESGFNPKAVSSAGARGVMQIMPNSARSAGVRNLGDPGQSIYGGARLLCKKEVATRRNKSPALVRALAAYNGGEGNVSAARIPVQLQQYAEKVLAASVKYKFVPGSNPAGMPGAPGAVKGGGIGMGNAMQEKILRRAFPNVRITSRTRPGSITSSGNLSMHAQGRALDIEPSKKIFDWIAKHYPNSRELIFTPAGGRQLKNGKPFVYGPVVAAGHHDHVHWAM